MNDNNTEQSPVFDLEIALNYVNFKAEGVSATNEQVLMAYQFLIKNYMDDLRPKHYKKAISIMELGMIDTDGNINWAIFDELNIEGYVI